jgi:alpha-amylase
MIQVSANLPEGYHGYYTTDFYQTNSRFGSAQDLKDLSAALHRRGMYLMLDVIANHVAVAQRTPFRPADGTWGVFNRDEDFHKLLWCRNYDDQREVEQCWLGELGDVALPDLNT